MNKRRKINSRDLDPIAQAAIKAAIRKALSEGAPDLTDNQKSNLFYQMYTKKDEYIVDFYTMPENATWDSKEALIVATAIVDHYSGE